jgi:hypothetical protein
MKEGISAVLTRNNKKHDLGSIKCFVTPMIFLLLYCGSFAQPELDFAYGFGNTQTDRGNAICLDDYGNSYITGFFKDSADFDPGPDSLYLIATGVLDIFVASYDSNGQLRWAFNIGGTGANEGYGITVDDSLNVYISGSFRNTVDFDPGPGVTNITSTHTADGFVAKYDQFANLLWAIGIGGTGNDQAYDVDIDKFYNVYVTGDIYLSADFDPGAGDAILTANGIKDVYLATYTSDGSYRWAISMGGSNTDTPKSLAVDSIGTSYIVGWFKDTADFNPDTLLHADLISKGIYDLFVASYDSSGDYRWAFSLGGTSNDRCEDIFLDAYNNLYITGSIYGLVDFDPGPGVSISGQNGVNHYYVASYDTDSSLRMVRTPVGTGSSQIGYGIGTDEHGNVYVTGLYGGTADFDMGPGIENRTSNGHFDIFVCGYDSLLNYRYVVTAGSDTRDEGHDIAVRPDGKVFNTGVFEGLVDFDPSDDTTNVQSLGASDIFLASYYAFCDLPIAHCRDVNVYLDDQGAFFMTPLAIDNGSFADCGVASFEISQDSFDCFNIGTNSVTLLLTDIFGDTSICLSAVTVHDTIPPDVSCQDITVYLDEYGKANISVSMVDNGSTDNCNLASINLDTDTLSCQDAGVKMVALFATDSTGNQDTCFSNVTIIDTFLPVATCQDITIALDSNGMVIVDPMWIDAGSSDNCGIVSYSLDLDQFTCADTGNHLLVLTVTDPSAAQDDCQANVEIVRPDNLYVTWSGAVSDDWQEPGNWEYACVPGVNDHALIPSGKPQYPLIPSGEEEEINTVHIQIGAILTVEGVLSIHAEQPANRVHQGLRVMHQGKIELKE